MRTAAVSAFAVLAFATSLLAAPKWRLERGVVNGVLIEDGDSAPSRVQLLRKGKRHLFRRLFQQATIGWI